MIQVVAVLASSLTGNARGKAHTLKGNKEHRCGNSEQREQRDGSNAAAASAGGGVTRAVRWARAGRLHFLLVEKNARNKQAKETRKKQTRE
jgi:hypothetical protein